LRQRLCLVTLAFIALPIFRLSAQSPLDSPRGKPTVSAVGDALHVKAPEFSFIRGGALDRLKEGRPVRFDFSLAVLSGRGGPVVMQTRQSFNLSYDLWEERFAVTRIGPPSPGFGAANSISHLTAKDAEAWCLEHLPLSASNIARGRPFWIRIQYQVVDRDPAPNPEEDALTLRNLIDVLSRRRKTGEQGDLLEAGPFRLPD